MKKSVHTLHCIGSRSANGYNRNMARQSYDYDLAIIGGGSAGIVAGNVAGGLGARVVLVERARLGGECLWTGCVPSKALLHVARMAHEMRTAGDTCGLQNVPLSRDDCAGAFDYVRAKINEVKNNDATETMLCDMGVEIVQSESGEGRFVSPHVFRTAQKDIKAAHFLIATGSSPVEPELPGLLETGYLTNKTLYDLTVVPESLVIIGGGYIACEMGQALSRLGCRVTILARESRLLPKEDAELVEVLTGVLRSEGVQIVSGADAKSVRAGAGGEKIVTVGHKENEQAEDFAAAEILVSVGRKANTDGLNLAGVGVQVSEKGAVVVNGLGQTTVSHIWAGGDVTGQFQFSHVAEHEAKIIVRNILFPGTQAIPYDVIPWATFTDPELARVGLTETEARQKYGPNKIQVLRHEFKQDDRAIVENRATGLVKAIVTGANGNVVGAHIIGPQAGEMIHEWVLVLRHNLPVRAIADLIHVYPTVSVSNQRAAQKWYADILGKPLVRGTLKTLFNLSPRDIKNLNH